MPGSPFRDSSALAAVIAVRIRQLQEALVIRVLPAILVLIVLSLLSSCTGDRADASGDLPPPLYPALKTAALNTEEGYRINPVTGDSIKPVNNLTTGIPLRMKGTVVQGESEGRYVSMNAGKPNIQPVTGNIRNSPGNLTVIPVEKEKLRTFTVGVDTPRFAWDFGVRTGAPIPAKGKVVHRKQTESVKAVPLQINEQARLNMRKLGESQGLKSSYVTCMAEDTFGRIWFGTRGGGVCVYDGASFEYLTVAEGLASNTILSIMRDSRGNLWIGTEGKGVCMYDGTDITQFNYQKGLFIRNVSTIMEDDHNNVWFGTLGYGIIKYDGTSFTYYTTNEGLINNDVHVMIQDSQGQIWIGTNTGACMFDGKVFTDWSNVGDLYLGGVSAITEDSHGNLWFGTGNHGAVKYDGESITLLTRKEGLINNTVWSIMEDSHGDLWFGTVKGLTRYNGESLESYTRENGLSGNLVSSILEDSSDNIWFSTTDGGVTRYDRNEAFTYPGVEADLGYAEAIAEDNKGSLWFGTERGARMLDGASISDYWKTQSPLNPFIHCIITDSKGDLWFGTSNGLIRKHGEDYTIYSKGHGLIGNNVRSVLEDSRGNIWFCTIPEGVGKYNGKFFTEYTGNEGGFMSTVQAISEDSRGNIWFGTWNNGAGMYDGESITHYTEKEGLSNNSVISVLEDRYGNIWLGTNGGGVSIFNGSTFAYLTGKEGLSDNYVQSLVRDNLDNIWIGTLHGLNYALAGSTNVFHSKSSLNSSGPGTEASKDSSVHLVIHTYGLQDGLHKLSLNFNSALLDSRNRIWWGNGNSGVAMLDMNKFRIPVVPPANLQIDRIDINAEFTDYRLAAKDKDLEYEFSGVARFNNCPLNLELPYDNNYLTFHFSAIDWAAPHKLLYSYRMEGLGDPWSKPSPVTAADYRNLPYGKYTFMVCAIGTAQQWSEPFEYSFVIRPPWWQSWIARTGFAVIAVLLVLAIVRWRTARLKERQQELEQTVRERTEEISQKSEELKQQNEELASQRDEIEAQRDLVTSQKDQILEQKEETMQSIQYARRIQAAILPPDEVLKYLLPKHFILYKPRDIVSGDFYWLTQKEDKIIIVVADCTGHGVPGAFMSMLGSALLNDAVNNLEKLQASLVLDELRDQVMSSLRQTGREEEAKDGMDIALCILDRKNNKVQFAGGYNPLYLVRNGELIEVKADKMPIGISSKAGETFTNNELSIRKGDALYMFSDGFIDQFGGPEGKKFMVTRFRKLLLDVQNKIMYEQKELLEQALNEWMGLTGKYDNQYEQVDDIIVMGIRV